MALLKETFKDPAVNTIIAQIPGKGKSWAKDLKGREPRRVLTHPLQPKNNWEEEEEDNDRGGRKKVRRRRRRRKTEF